VFLGCFWDFRGFGDFFCRFQVFFIVLVQVRA
jgi:hypothetical protein